MRLTPIESCSKYKQRKSTDHILIIMMVAFHHTLFLILSYNKIFLAIMMIPIDNEQCSRAHILYEELQVLNVTYISYLREIISHISSLLSLLECNISTFVHFLNSEIEINKRYNTDLLIKSKIFYG